MGYLLWNMFLGYFLEQYKFWGIVMVLFLPNLFFLVTQKIVGSFHSWVKNNLTWVIFNKGVFSVSNILAFIF